VVSILIRLNPDRNSYGELSLEDDTGQLIFGPLEVAARASDRAARDHHNEGRHPLLTYGDTPTGIYRVNGIIKSGSGTVYDAGQYGPYGLIVMTAIHGNAALAEANGRFQFFIQGGAKGRNGKLRSTNGCLRLSDTDQKRLIARIRGLDDIYCHCSEEDVASVASVAIDGVIFVDDSYDEGDPPHLAKTFYEGSLQKQYSRRGALKIGAATIGAVAMKQALSLMSANVSWFELAPSEAVAQDYGSPAPVETPSTNLQPFPQNSAVPGPEQSAVPGPEQSAVPGPEQSAVPGPEQSAVPGPEQSAVPGPEQSAAPSPEESAVPSPEESAVPSSESTPIGAPPVVQRAPAASATSQIVRYKLRLIIRAFIPSAHPLNPGYIIAIPGLVNTYAIKSPIFLDSSCFMTDNRSFSDDINASSRMTTEFVLLISNTNVMVDRASGREIQRTDPTRKVNCQTGVDLVSPQRASTSHMSIGHPFLSGDLVQIYVDGRGSNPLAMPWLPTTPSIGAPDIQYGGSFIFNTTDRSLKFTGSVKSFPAYEAYAQINDGPVTTLFQRSPTVSTVSGLIDFGTGFRLERIDVTVRL
jgi:hypothetical protein